MPPIHQADRSWEQLGVELAGIKNATLVALAAEQHTTILWDSAWPYEVPVKGLGIGQ